MSFAAILWKDARRELRQRETLQAGLVLVLAFVLLDLFAFPTLAGDARAAAAALWTPLLFGAAALAGRGFAAESDLGTLDLLRALPVPLGHHGWSRTLLNGLLLGLLAALTLGAAAALFAVPVSAALGVAAALAVVGLAVVGTLASAIAAQARSREMLLPLLMVPVLAPLLQSGVAATLAALQGGELAAARIPLLLMAGYDLLAAGVAWLLWPLVLEGD
ncbi:MAG: heme exporter protein CcmB [Thermoplasmatota archaeon]